MRPWVLEETNWKSVKNRKYEVAVLPWGATEPHNYHLPYGTDSLETTQIAYSAAEKAWERNARVVVLPTIPFGVQNPGQTDMPFCIHMRPSTQIIVLEDIVRSLFNQGIFKLVIMNGHGGNDFKPHIREMSAVFPGMFIALNQWFKLAPDSRFFEEEGDHANEMETSIMMHYFPELVLPLHEAGEGQAKRWKIKSLEDETAWSPRRWNEVSDDTGIGNPKKASARKGQLFLEEITKRIGDFLAELAEADLNDLYE